MSTSIIGCFRSEVECVRSRIEESHLNAVRDILPDAAIEDACREAKYEFRRRL